MIDATPEITRQLSMLDEVTGDVEGAVLDGVLLTHAHMGHYAGLVHLGREALAARAMPVLARPRMASFLRENSPWSELLDHGHVDLVEIETRVELSPRISVTAIPVPHRDELSDTVGYLVEGPNARVLWLPDIDGWDAWDQDLASVITEVDHAYLDGTFFDEHELERDMSMIPHPRILDTVTRISRDIPQYAERIRFIHLNHTNPALDEDSPERALIENTQMAVAVEGEIVTL